MMDTMQALLELVINEKYTIVYFDRVGYPKSVKFYLKGVGQHRVGKKTAVRLVIKPSGGPVRDVLIDPNNQFIVFNSWHTPDCDIVVKFYQKDSGHGIFKMAQTWAKFDPRYMNKARDSEPGAVLIWNIKELKEEVFRDLCYIHD